MHNEASVDVGRLAAAKKAKISPHTCQADPLTPWVLALFYRH